MEAGTILLHEGDDKNDLNKLKPKIAHTFNLKINEIKLIQENDFLIVQLKKWYVLNNIRHCAY